MQFQALNGKLNPLYFTVILTAVPVYSGMVVLCNTKPLVTLIDQSQINRVVCQISSNPVMSSNGNYCCNITVSGCYCSYAAAAVWGQAKLVFNKKLAEQYYPGKLYTLWNKKDSSFLLEIGANLDVNVKYLYTSSNNVCFFQVETVNSCSFNQNIFGRFNYIRGLFRLYFKRLMYGWGKAGALFLALLSSSKEYLDSDISQLFRLSGLSHILALSGMHLSLILGISGLPGNYSKHKNFFLIGQNLCVLIFVWFAGFSPSLLRAFISCCINSLGKLIKVKQRSQFDVLVLTFIIHFLIRYEDLTNLAFILSYGALAGILIFSQFIKRYISICIPSKISDGISASIGAQIFTAPVSLKVFGYYCPGSIFSTLTVSPLITLFIYAGLVLMILCCLIPDLTQLCGTLMNYIYDFINFSINIWNFIPAVSR